ncbi:MAG: hypothetical protein EP330_02595 [Deltaproteobacteria bacterium]|nr:MAG: hypothetical protein EP330_02595 [Deltaproteobacteria bacterium]
MLNKLSPLLLALCVMPTLTSSAWAQSSIEDLDADGGKKASKKKKAAGAAAAETEVIREIERGLYIKAGMGTTAYLLNYGSGVLRSGTTMALTLGQDFLDQERRSMAWEVAFTTGLHNGMHWDLQRDVGVPQYIQGDTRTFQGSGAYEFSIYPARRLGIGVRLGGGVMYSPLLIHEQTYATDVVTYWGVDPGVHNSIHPFGFGGPTVEYYTKLSHFSVGADVDVAYMINWDLGVIATGYAKFSF